MSKYDVRQDQGHYTTVDALDEAICLAEVLLGGVQGSEESTFSVHDSDGNLKASVTNRRIIGTFYKQRWGGWKEDQAISCGEEEFDATNAVLLLEPNQVAELASMYELTDTIGRDHVEWDGPCDVYLDEAVCAFFGVGDLEEITPEALAFARSRHNPKPLEEHTLAVSVKIHLRVAPGVNVGDFLTNMSMHVRSQTPGITMAAVERA